ncbi:hypothetical protein FDECE_14808 [Fusarium decemcellulare]|nr:hypothetical protein FDECE_14808 [Fusarium decemcellulare]
MMRFTLLVALVSVPFLTLASGPDLKKRASIYEERHGPYRYFCNNLGCNWLADMLVRESMSLDTNTNPCEDWDKYVCDRFRKTRVETYVIRENARQVNQSSVMNDYQSQRRLVQHAIDSVGHWGPLNLRPGETGERDIFNRIHAFQEDCLNFEQGDIKGFKPLEVLAGIILKAFHKYDAGSSINIDKPINTVDHDMIRNATFAMGKYGVWAFAKFAPQQSVFNSSKMAISIKPWLSPGLPYKEGYYDRNVARTYRDVIKLALDIMAPSRLRHDGWEKIANNIVDLEREIIELAPSQTDWNSFRYWSRITGKQLDEMIPELGLATVIKSQPIKGMKPPMDDLEIMAPEFWRKLSELLKKKPRKTVRAYFLWQGWLQFRIQRPNKADRKYRGLLKSILGVPPLGNDRARCRQRVLDNFPDMIGASYVRMLYKQRWKFISEDIVNNIKSQYIRMFEETTWLSEEARELLIDKALKMTTMIGYQEQGPDLMIWDEITKYYKDFKFTGRRTYVKQGLLTEGSYKQAPARHVEDFINLKAYHAKKSWEALSKPPSAYKWSISPWDQHVAYSHQLNKLMSPAAIIPYSEAYPSYVNYAYYGTMIAQQMLHAFDDVGITMSPNGTHDEWMPEADLVKFNNRTRCFYEKYDGMKVNTGDKKFEPPLKVSARLVLNNIIGDTQGTEVAYRAWKSRNESFYEPALRGLGHLTNDQIFFVVRSFFHCTKQRDETWNFQVYVGPDAPPTIRSGQPLKDLRSWNEAFQCKPPKKICNLYGAKWPISKKKVLWHSAHEDGSLPAAPDPRFSTEAIERDKLEYQKKIGEMRRKRERAGKKHRVDTKPKVEKDDGQPKGESRTGPRTL